MGDSLKDPKVIIGILAIINAIVLALVFQWWRNRKSLSCEIVSDIPLFSVSHEIKHRVRVLLDGKPVENVYLVIMKVENTGRVPIDDKDFIIPISVNFGENSEILTAEITETSPSDLPAKIIREKQCVTVHPLMLNGGDTITIKILVSKRSNLIGIAGRVKGVRQLKKHGTLDVPRSSSRDGFGGCLLVAVMTIVFMSSWYVGPALLSLEQLGFFRYILALILAPLSFFGSLHFFQRALDRVYGE